jgi:hypothetical protein
VNSHKEASMVQLVRAIGAACVLAAVAVLAACGGSPPSGTPAAALPTSVTVLAVNSSVGRALFELSCTPPDGDLPDPAAACRAVDKMPELVTNPEPITCLGGTFSWWSLTITGEIHGEPFETNVATCWTPQMRLIDELGLKWEVLQTHLLPRRVEELDGPAERTFAAGELETGDLVICMIDGRPLENGIPELGSSEQTGWDGLGIRGVWLDVKRHADGSLTAACTRDA